MASFEDSDIPKQEIISVNKASESVINECSYGLIIQENKN